MLDVKDEKYLESVRAFADTLGPEVRAQFEGKLEYLAKYRGDTCVCELYKDFAPQSFSFVLYGPENEDGLRKPWFNGGLIFHSGSTSGAEYPVLAVDLSGDTKPHWNVHT